MSSKLKVQEMVEDLRERYQGKASDVLDVLEAMAKEMTEMNLRIKDLEREIGPNDSFIHIDGPHRLS